MPEAERKTEEAEGANMEKAGRGGHGQSRNKQGQGQVEGQTGALFDILPTLALLLSILHIAARMILLKCKSLHVPALLRTLAESYPPNIHFLASEMCGAREGPFQECESLMKSIFFFFSFFL